MRFNFFFFILLFSASNIFGQDSFVWNSKKDKIEVPFEHIFNLIIIPVEINNTKLNMLLDTGTENSIIFSISEKDSINFYNSKKIKIKGLGSEKMIEALESKNNSINIFGYRNDQFSLQIVLDQDVNFSSRLGIPVNGILGYSFFQNNLIEINYQRKVITLYREKAKLKQKRIKKYTKIPIEIIDHRPYINVETQLEDKNLADLKLLVDIGLGDGLWLFEDNKVKSGTNYFEDILGRGLSGDVTGKRSRITSLKIADFELNEPLVCYPHKIYFPKIGMVSGRNGSVGGEILHRFNLILDYEGKNVFLKKNSNFSKSFHYNMSGIEIEHNGIEYFSEKVEVREKSGKNFAENQGEVVYRANDFKYEFSLKPVFKIVGIRKNSPADLSGIKEGDKIIRINKKSVHKYSLQKISELFQSEEEKWIYIDIERDGVPIAFKFQLKKII